MIFEAKAIMTTIKKELKTKKKKNYNPTKCNCMYSYQNINFLLLLELVDLGVDVLALFGHLLHPDEEVDAIDEHVDELDLGEAESIGVGDIKDTADGLAVYATGASLLESHLVQDLLESAVGGNVWDLDVDAASYTGTEVGWASEHVSEVLVPHEIVAVGLDGGFELVETITPSGEDFLHVAVLLHGDDSDVVLFVDPDEEVLGAVVPDTSALWPIASHTGAGEEWGDWLVEEEVVVDELVLLGLGHLSQWVVLAGEFAAQVGETINNDLLDHVSLSSAAPWWHRVAPDGSAGSASRGDDVVHVELVAFDLGWVEAGLMLVGWLVAGVSGLNDWVEEFLEDFVGLLVTGDATDGHNEWMAWVVYTSLDGVVDGVAGWGLLASEAFVHLQSEHMCHVVVVLLEAWVFILGSELGLVKVGHGW